MINKNYISKTLGKMMLLFGLSIAPIQILNAEEAAKNDLGGLVEKLEQEDQHNKTGTVIKFYDDLREYLFKPDEIPKGFTIPPKLFLNNDTFNNPCKMKKEEMPDYYSYAGLEEVLIADYRIENSNGKSIFLLFEVAKYPRNIDINGVKSTIKEMKQDLLIGEIFEKEGASSIVLTVGCRIGDRIITDENRELKLKELERDYKDEARLVKDSIEKYLTRIKK